MHLSTDSLSDLSGSLLLLLHHPFPWSRSFSESGLYSSEDCLVIWRPNCLSFGCLQDPILLNSCSIWSIYLIDRLWRWNLQFQQLCFWLTHSEIILSCHIPLSSFQFQPCLLLQISWNSIATDQIICHIILRSSRFQESMLRVNSFPLELSWCLVCFRWLLFLILSK